jgi:N-acetylmuramoyl-L-alanine amidase
MKLCIDAGHGGTDPGSSGPGLVEKDFTLALALLLEEELESRGHWVVMSRRRDRTLALAARAAFANRLEADVFVSLHANAAGRPDVQGMEAFHFTGSAAGRTLGRSVLASMLAAFPGHRDRGVKPARFLVLRATRMPSILVECEFLTNPRQARFLAARANQLGLARAIAAGIEAAQAPVA